MRASILDLENKLLECASGPINMRKMLVRDVLLKREEEVASSEDLGVIATHWHIGKVLS